MNCLVRFAVSGEDGGRLGKLRRKRKSAENPHPFLPGPCSNQRPPGSTDKLRDRDWICPIDRRRVNWARTRHWLTKSDAVAPTDLEAVLHIPGRLGTVAPPGRNFLTMPCHSVSRQNLLTPPCLSECFPLFVATES